VGETCLGVSIAPVFTPGNRYLMCVNDDGGTYANPLIGGPQGLFKVVRDTESTQEYALTAGSRIFHGDENGGLIRGPSRVAGIRNGTPVDHSPSVPTVIQSAPPPVPHQPGDGSAPASAFSKPSAIHSPLTLEAFIQYIRDVALRVPVHNPRLRREKTAGSITTRMSGEEYPSAMEQDDGAMDELSLLAAESSSPLGGDLGYCGYHKLPFIMETVPTDWWSYDTFEAARNTWNWFMAIYQKIPCDDKFGHNLRNEVCGWVDEAEFQRVYGSGWNGAVGMSVTWWTGNPCGRLVESDILFNPDYEWTDKAENAWGNNDVLLLRPVAMHEMGHTWGMQRGDEENWGYDETYDYDQLTVMHKAYHDIIEDGRGIHVIDAYCLRRNYQNQTEIKKTADVGVESYYASDGLHNSTANQSSYYPGDAITLKNITVENIGFLSAANVRIRIFLSTDRNITNDDYQVGSYWSWDTLARETRSVFDVNSTIPDNVPAGTYYIGMIITVKGLQNDDYTFNNRTTFAATIQIKARVSGGDNGDGNGGGGCFIATAAFGSPLAAQVVLLRDFRDQFLMASSSGRNLVQAYYHYSPPLARFISKYPPLKIMAQNGLLPLVTLLQVVSQLKI
jgi:hypothetical protein